MAFPSNMVELELIAIGSQAYVLNSATSQWEVFTDPASAFTGPATLVAVDPSRLQAAVFMGETSLEGVPVYHVRAEIPSGTSAKSGDSGSDVDLEVDYWIGREDFLVRQFYSRPATTAGANDDVLETRARLSDFSKPVDIQAPEVSAR